MDRIVYVNGEYLPESEAKISIFDRGFLFADGVYEVSSVIDGKLVDNAAHLARLERSLAELRIKAPCSGEEITAIQEQIIARNRLEEGVVYLQVTRGSADRDFAYPSGAEPSLIMFSQAKVILANPQAETGISVITIPDIRWQRRDIKSVGLLPAAMAKQAALDAGAQTPGWSRTATSPKAAPTTPTSSPATARSSPGALSNAILHGITRRAVLELAAKAGLEVVERRFTPEEAYQAAEAFFTSASSFVLPVVEIDGRKIGDGTPGPATRALRGLYVAMAKETAVQPEPALA